jgi:hypothetical protein
VFVFSCFSKISRTERIRKTYGMMFPALYQHEVTEGLGIAFDADNSETGFDLLWVRNYNGFSAEDKRLAELLFPKNRTVWVADPFGKARPYGPE